MHTKVINPLLDGHRVYANTGSVDALVEYLLHEAKEQWAGEDIFFDATGDGLEAARVRAAINRNARGLKEGEEKFYTMILSPSEDELRHIGNSDQKLKQFARAAMKAYAENFCLPDGKKLAGEDLLWFATLHADREFKHTDLRQEGEEELTNKERAAIERLEAEGEARSLKKAAAIRERARQRYRAKWDREVFQAGDKKPGLNKHIHIIVSRQDRARRYSLNPRGRTARFSLRQWQEGNAETFKALFGYSRQNTYEGFYFSRKEAAYWNRKIEDTLEEINSKWVHREKLDAERIKRLGARFNYSRIFFINLGKMKNHYRQGHYFVDPYFFMARGRDITPEEYARLDRVPHGDRAREGEQERRPVYGIATARKGGHRLQGLLSALARGSRPGGFVRESFLFDFEKQKRKRCRQPEREAGGRAGEEREIDR